MVWISLALFSAAAFGLVAILDKRLIDKYMPSLSSYYVLVGGSVLLYGIVFLAFHGIPASVSTSHVFAAGISGLCWGGALALTLWGFKLQEVSRASAVVYTFPVFVALLAMGFLGESLSLSQWLAMTVVVGGALMISMSGSSGSWFSTLNRAFPILIVASLLTAVGHVTGKYALAELPVGLVTSLRFFGMALVLVSFWRPQTFGQLAQVIKHKEAVALFVLAEIVLVPLAIVSMITATKLGPVSLVAVILGARPVFVLLFGTVLSLPSFKVLSESLDRRSLIVKIASVVLIIGGVMSL